MSWGVEVILGMNGYIWVGKPRKAISELDLDAIYSSRLEEVTLTLREAIVRTCSAILFLDRVFEAIDEESITKMYKRIETIPIGELGTYAEDEQMQLE